MKLFIFLALFVAFIYAVTAKDEAKNQEVEDMPLNFVDLNSDTVNYQKENIERTKRQAS